jgi:hypothetical protein
LAASFHLQSGRTSATNNPINEEGKSALPLLGAKWGENGPKARHQFADPGDGMPNRLAGTIQVQDEARPQAVRGFQTIGTFDDHTCFVVNALDACTRLSGLEVVEDFLPPFLVGHQERLQLREGIHGVKEQFQDLPASRAAIRDFVEDLLEAQTQLVQLLQPGQLVEQLLQFLPIVRLQLGRIAAKLP